MSALSPERTRTWTLPIAATALRRESLCGGSCFVVRVLVFLIVHVATRIRGAVRWWCVLCFFSCSRMSILLTMAQLKQTVAVVESEKVAKIKSVSHGIRFTFGTTAAERESEEARPVTKCATGGRYRRVPS